MADKALEADGARPMRLMRLKRPSPADKFDEADAASVANEALEADGARPMRPTRLKTPSPANKVDEANGMEPGRRTKPLRLIKPGQRGQQG